MRIRVVSVVSVAACALAIAPACDPMSAPLYRYHPGYQLRDDSLRVWMGTECARITSVVYQLKDAEGDVFETWRLKARSRRGASLDYLTVGVVPKGFVGKDPLTEPWESAATATIDVRTHWSRRNLAGNYMSVDTFVEEADDKSEDEWFIQDEGWYTQDEYTSDLVGEESGIFPLCGPDSPAHP
ncbi:MAG: hypothetical protein H0U28_16360 [Nocardioidaceae bacterium]|nr:hypothetical protein [Nocardioidaceae bacterium]